MMKSERIFHGKPLKAFLIFAIVDSICMGMGMGVPLFNIMLGFLIGWYIVKWKSVDTSEVNDILKTLLLYSCITAGVTFFGMILIWGWSVKLLFGTDADIMNFGIPMILYEPRKSLIAWLLLMIFISPFLQLLTTVFAGHITLMSLQKKNTKGEKSGATS